MRIIPFIAALAFISTANAQQFSGPAQQPDPWSYGPSLSIFYKNGGVVLGNATGGTQGIGTINLSGGLYINGTPVGFSNLAANTVFGNFTSSSHLPVANAMPSCTASNCALQYTPNTGFTTNTAISAAAGSLSGATLAAGVTASSLTSVGTIATGVWNATPILVAKGGTGLTTLTAHGVMIGEGTSNVAVTAAGSAGQVLTSNGASSDPTWQTTGGIGIEPPQGRLTLTSGTPIMTSTTAGQTTIYYTPDRGTFIPIPGSAGGAFTNVSFTELSQSTTDTTVNPTAVAPNSCYDEFVWSNGGTVTLSRGPAWDTCAGAGSRNSGGAIARPSSPNNGYLVNSVSITNGPAAGLGTWVGTIASNGSSTIDWIYGASASGGTAGSFGVWNAYNQAPVYSITQDSSINYTYATTSFRQAHASAGMQCSFVSGSVGRQTFDARYAVASVGTNTEFTAVGFNSTTVASGVIGQNSNGNVTMTSSEFATSYLGFDTFAALEKGASGGSFNFNGNNGIGGLTCNGMM